MSVLDWEYGVRTSYTSRDPVRSPNNRSRMRNYKVIKIRRYKAKRHGNHEYLVAKVSDPYLDQPRYLRIERVLEPEEARDLPPTNDNTGRSSHPITPRSSQSSLSPSPSQSSLGPFEPPKKLPARSYVRPLAKWPTGDSLTHKLNCKDSQMILLDLVLVAKVVLDHSGKYGLF